MLKKIISTFRIFKRNTIKVPIQLQKNSEELIWAAVFNSTISDSEWLKNKSFSPGRWAAGYPLLYILYRIYNDIKPKSVLEFGVGETTKLGYQYATHHKTNYQVVEHDEKWLSFFCEEKYDIKKHLIKTSISEQQFNGFPTNIYDNLIEKIGKEKYDLIIIDGPFGSPHFSRNQILEIVNNDNLASSFVIIMDDYNRKGEQETIDLLKINLSKKSITYYEGIYSGQKDSLIICSENYRFLCSL
ncbi:hypothetical protein ACQKCH_13480 [Nubsella zeaxanthinifaciens]|uniref:hypothetical protein n=1 Tax=Nubsella zeaxanthinifaciens TaxID=392412 RepID=UPI003D04245D